MSGSSYFEVSDDDDPPLQGALIEVQYEPPLDKMKAWNQKRERTVGTVAWALTQHSHYDPSSGTVQFDVKVGTENDVSNAYRFFDRNIKNGQLRFQTAHTAGKEARWIEVNGGYSQDFRDCDNNKPLYQNTTSYARGEDSHVQQNQGVIMLDCSSDSYEQLCKLDKSGMAALDKVARGLMANVLEPVMEVGKEAVLYSAHVLQVSSFGGLTFHVDHNEFDKDVHVTLSVLLAQPDKTVFMAEAAREAKWTGVGQWKVFSSDKFHRSGTILREGAMQLTFFARVKKGSWKNAEYGSLHDYKAHDCNTELIEEATATLELGRGGNADVTPLSVEPEGDAPEAAVVEEENTEAGSPDPPRVRNPGNEDEEAVPAVHFSSDETPAVPATLSDEAALDDAAALGTAPEDGDRPVEVNEQASAPAPLLHAPTAPAAESPSADGSAPPLPASDEDAALGDLQIAKTLADTRKMLQEHGQDATGIDETQDKAEQGGDGSKRKRAASNSRANSPRKATIPTPQAPKQSPLAPRKKSTRWSKKE